MQIQTITSQPNFNGKVVFEHGTTKDLTKFTPEPLWLKFREISKLVSDKPYDIFISKNKKHADFYDIAANETFEKAQKVKGYTVKVQKNSITESIVDAAKEAMDMYEKYIAKGIKG